MGVGISGVETADGQLIVAAGNRVSPTFLERITNYSQLSGIKEPILVEKGTGVVD